MKQTKKGFQTYLSNRVAYYLICLVGSIPLSTSAQTGDVNQTLKDVYKDAFLIGAAVNPSITSGRNKASQDIVLKHFKFVPLIRCDPAAAKYFRSASMHRRTQSTNVRFPECRRATDSRSCQKNRNWTAVPTGCQTSANSAAC